MVISINSINSLKRTTNNVSFTGHNLTENDKGEKTYKFYIPKVSYEKATLLLKKFRRDDNGKIITDSNSREEKFDIPKNSPYVEINPKDLKLSSKEVLGYRFIIDGEKFTDKHRGFQVDNIHYNIADSLASDIIQTPKSLYHLIPGVFKPDLKQKKYINAQGIEVLRDDKTARSNHFMKFDAKLTDIIEKIPHIKELGFRRILSTPIFGQDNISGVGYWTANPFQITERLGSMSDFQKLQIELFKKSMGFVADGAFTSEGLMGIHFRDVLRHGQKSPFYRWFEIKEKPMLGVLPDKDSVMENVEIKVINSPYIWDIDENGLPGKDFGKKNENYNYGKETYIQIYDKRLTSKEQLESGELFTTYDIKAPAGDDRIESWNDSVNPYSFPVNLNELKNKIQIIKNNPHVPAKNHLLNWERYSLTTAGNSANVMLWTGDKDIAKLRFSIPDYKKKEIIDNSCNKDAAGKEIEKIEDATQRVQDYIVSIGEFWTNKTAKTLREYIASQLSGAKTPEDFLKKIKAKAGKDLPVETNYITLNQIQNAMNDEYRTIKLLKYPHSINSALREYPLEALEVGDDLTTMFAYPQFKEALNEKFYKGVIGNRAIEILRELDKMQLPCGNLVSGADIASGKEKIVQLISDDIARFILLKALNPSLTVKDITENSKESLNLLKDITAANLCTQTKNYDAAETLLFRTMDKNIKKISNEDIAQFAAYLKDRIGTITPESIKIADLIIDKTEAGLNWRMDAAKDIGDIEAYENGRADVEETWGSAIDFWTKFNNGIKLYNAHAYKIAELTDVSVAPNEANLKYSNAGDLEQKFIENAGFTTQTNYSYLFDSLQRILSRQPEFRSAVNSNVLDIMFNKFERGWEGVPGYLFSGSKNNIAFSHVAVDNHDKQRIAHTFSMNMLLAYLDTITFSNLYRSDNYWKNIANELKSDLAQSSMDKSKHYEKIQNGQFKQLFFNISPKNLAKIAAYNDAFATVVKKQKNGEKLRTEFSKALDTLATNGAATAKNFFYQDFETSFEDILNLIPKENKKQIKDLKAAIHEALTLPARIRGVELAKLMVAVPGNPTIFAGDELLELGGEEKAKNVTLQNRNRLHWEHFDDDAYSHIKEYSEQLSKIFNLRNDENMSSLVNGDTLLLKKQGELGPREIVGLYRYNEHDDCIILVHNEGYNSSRHFNDKITMDMPYVDLSSGMQPYYPEGWNYRGASAFVGLPKNTSLKNGSVFVDALDSKNKFIVKEDGKLYNKKGGSIELEHAVTILKRVK